MLIEKYQGVGPAPLRGKLLILWAGVMAAMSATGLAIAIIGVRALM
jgi:hypothetical protein